MSSPSSLFERKDEVESSGLLDSPIVSAARRSPRSIVPSRYYRGELPELRRESIGPDLVFSRLWTQGGCREGDGLLADRVGPPSIWSAPST